MATRIEHPQGLPPPEEWIQTGHAKVDEFREWLASDKPKQKKSKYNARKVYIKEIDRTVNSLLEAKTVYLLLFKGYQYWKDKITTPPAEGLWFAYERRRFKFTLKPGTDSERTVNYLPDLELWRNGTYEVWECKGYVDDRAKRNEKLMRKFHPDLPYDVITESVLDGMALEAIRDSRRRQGPGAIPGWE